MKIPPNRDGWIRLLSLATIYVVWGSTYLAIRVGVRFLPPVLFAAMRFVTAGLLLLIWAVWRREPMARGREWISILSLGSLFFLLDYSVLFWAEKRVDSSLAAVLMATIPLFMTACEALVLKSIRFTGKLVGSLLLGSLGVCVLMSHSLHVDAGWVTGRAVVALLIAAATWSFGSVVSRRLPLSASTPVSAALQMLAGGLLLTVLAGMFGETRGLDIGQVPQQVWLCLAYLVVPGSVFGFTAYLWLLQNESPSKVGTYAYVNPVVAGLIGVFFAGEQIGLTTAVGSGLIVLSVVLVTLASGQSASVSKGALGHIEKNA